MQPVIARRLLDWQDGQAAPPWELMVCPTYRCNLKCGICSRSWQEQEHPALHNDLPDDCWFKLLDEAAELGARYLNIGGGGEPTLRRELVLNLCAKAKTLGMEGHLQTNGTKLTDSDIETLIRIKWDHITLSLDGPTPEINDSIRYHNAFNETVKRLQSLKELKKRHRSSLPNTQINMVITALNYDKLESMVSFCLENDVKMLSVVHLLEYSPNMTAYILTSRHWAKLPEYVDRAIEKADAFGLSHNLDSLLFRQQDRDSGLSRTLDSAASSLPKNHIANVRCLEPWRGVVVTSSGHTMPCCFFWDEHADSIAEQRLGETWMGPYLSNFRKQMRSGELPAPCIDCKYPDSQGHRQLITCVQQATLAMNSPTSAWNTFAVKAWRSLRKNGVRASWGRYRQWRAIQRGLRDEH